MRGIFRWLMVVVILIAAVQPSYAVDKKQKDQPKKAVTDTAKKSDSTKKGDEAKAKTPAKKYNSFVDKNNNGIDDRRENLRTKQVATPKVDSTKTTQAKAKDSTKVANKQDTTKNSSKTPAKKKK